MTKKIAINVFETNRPKIQRNRFNNTKTKSENSRLKTLNWPTTPKDSILKTKKIRKKTFHENKEKKKWPNHKTDSYP